MIVRPATDTELRALGRAVLVCECGVALDVHPPLPKPLPWDHGRPCAAPTTGRYEDEPRAFGARRVA